MKLLVSILFMTVLTVCQSLADQPKPGQVFWESRFNTNASKSGSLHENTLALSNDDPKQSVTKSFTLPVEQMRGTYVSFGADVRAENVSQKPHPWNGVKVMAVIESPSGKQYPQPDLPAGTFDWQRAASRVLIPSNATSVTLVLGLEQTSGKVWFDNARVTYVKSNAQVPDAPKDQPIFRGHSLPRLRGAMIAPDSITEADFKVLADWGCNLVRWQLIRTGKADASFESYDRWLVGQLDRLDKGLVWAQRQGVKVVLDLHSPPGGNAVAGGYQAATGGIWTNPDAQDHFIEVWKKMAARYKGDERIWGYDLLNEPVDDSTSENCLDWQGLALRASKAIREVDPHCTLIIEPPQWGSAQGFTGFQPLAGLSNIVYSFHFYNPTEFTHQGVFDSAGPIRYPGKIAGKEWNKAEIQAAMAPAIDFANRYRVHMYVGEFSAIRWAPGAEDYLSDLLTVMESHGWDWTYHAFREWDGWSVEHTADKNNHDRATEPTSRQKALLKWMKQNERAK